MNATWKAFRRFLRGRFSPPALLHQPIRPMRAIEAEQVTKLLWASFDPDTHAMWLDEVKAAQGKDAFHVLFRDALQKATTVDVLDSLTAVAIYEAVSAPPHIKDAGDVMEALIHAAAPPPPYTQLHFICVHPNHARRSGYGGQLLRHRLARLPARTPLVLWTSSPENVVWYQSHGFVVHKVCALDGIDRAWWMTTPGRGIAPESVV